MIVSNKTYYDILSVRENSSYEEIRRSYRSAILSVHPDKLSSTSDVFASNQNKEGMFLKIQKAWEILSETKSRAVYDKELKNSREEALVSEDIGTEDMIVEGNGEVTQLFYQCRCGDYFGIDSLELKDMGYTLLRNGSKICLRGLDVLPSSLIIPCSSCSLQIIGRMIERDIDVKIIGWDAVIRIQWVKGNHQAARLMAALKNLDMFTI